MNVTGRYHYHRIGHDERPMELLPDGTIGAGAEGAERPWYVREEPLTTSLVISGDICGLTLRDDGCWRGRWLQFEKMRVELVPQRLQPLRSLEDRGGLQYEPNRFHYISYAKLIQDATELARRLPPLRTVAGVPRSGMLPASVIALERNVPPIAIEDLIHEERPEIPLPRRAYNRRVHDGIVLVVDDTCASGRQMDRLRSLIRGLVSYAAIYVENRPALRVDYFHSRLPDLAQFYEWTMFHDENNRQLLVDMDGVLCADWHGGSETENAAEYLRFLNEATPLRIPSIPLKGIVTNRLERHRPETEAWLNRQGIDYGFLAMSPYPTFEARDRARDAAVRKATYYAADPAARLFVESDDAQALDIARLTRRPVFSMARNGLVTV